MTDKLLLCATDLEDDAAPDLGAAACRALNAKMLLVHACDPTAHVDAPASVAPAIEELEHRLSDRRAEAEKKLEATRARLSAAGCAVEAKLIEGATPADAILHEAQESKPTLIVLGRRHEDKTLLARTIDQVCRRAPCPIFVAPGGGPIDLEGARWLVGADLSSHSVRALRATRALAMDGDAIRVVQVVAPLNREDDEIDRSPQEILRDQAMKEDAAHLRALVSTELGEAAESAQIKSIARAQDALNQEAEDWNASVIVVGTHGRSGLARLFLGSTAEAMLRTATRPVLVVRDAPHATSPLYPPVLPEPARIGPSRIVVATDFSEPAHRALETARELGRSLGAKVWVVHVFDDPGDVRRGIVGRGLDAPRASALPEGAKAQLEEALRTLVADVFGEGAGSVETELAVGRPVDQIVRRARAHHADLLIVGTTGRAGVERLLLGSVAEKVVREATIPVLTVP